jgi:hypothetical protein
MNATYGEILTMAIKCQHEPNRIVVDLPTAKMS